MRIQYDEKHRKPYISIQWNDPESDAVGWLVVYNFVNHFCSGGTRMHPSVTEEEVYRLARAMAYKYKACESKVTGGCKAGIRYDHKAPDARDVLKRFNIAMAPLMKHGVNLGGDMGVDATVVFAIWGEIGMEVALTKAMKENPKVQQGIKNHDEMCNMKLDRFLVYDMITGYGVAHGTDECWIQRTGKSGGASVVIQGFGCLGASAAYKLEQMGYTIKGIADANAFVYCSDGLNVNELLDNRVVNGEMNLEKLPSNYEVMPNSKWIEADCDILIPAALEDVINGSNAHMIKAQLISEGANICTTPEADKILFEKGIDVGVDFIVNLGATRYYDSILWHVVDKDPQAAIDDVEAIIRKDVRLLYDEIRKTGEMPRQIAERIFVPDTFDTPDIWW
jgi:Glutamate dehydrogenase/leucine dehydrogenase